MNPDRIPREVWEEYGELQSRVDHVFNLAHSSWAVEDQLNSFLDSLANGTLSADADTRQRKLHNLKVNRQKKHLYRLRLVEAYAATQAAALSGTTAVDHVFQAEQMARVRSLTTLLEWRVLWRLARDEGYERIALDESINVSALKTRVSRCRCRLRACLAA